MEKQSLKECIEEALLEANSRYFLFSAKDDFNLMARFLSGWLKRAIANDTVDLNK